MKLALAAFAVGLVAALVGWVWLGEVGELKLRTERSVATYQDGMLIYTTLAGTEASIPVWNECKNLGPRPANECIAYYENGDEVVITYDSAEPTNAWRGPTPNGVPATGLFWGGIALGIFALFGIWFTSSWYRRISRPTIAGQGAPPVED